MEYGLGLARPPACFLAWQPANAWPPEHNEKEPHKMGDIKIKANKKINAAADAAKKVTSTVIDKTRDVAHAAGQKLQEGGKRLKGV